MEATNFKSNSLGINPTMPMDDCGEEKPVATKAHKSKGQKRIARLADSSKLADDEAVFYGTTRGIKD